MRDRPLGIFGAFVVVVVAALLIWVLFIRDGEDSVAQAGEGPVIASESELQELAAEVGHPVYWAGPPEGAQLEVTRTADERIYVRYIAEDSEAGDPNPGFLTVGTYRLADAEESLQGAAERQGAIVEEGVDGTTVVSHEEHPTSVYFASPNGRFQVEVYDPDPARALELATTGQVRPVG